MIGLFISFISLAYIIYIYTLWISNEEKDYNYKGKYSVIIPCYNEGKKELIQCVESCLKASKGDVILVDNNSNKQETHEAIIYLKQSYPKLIILHESRQGKRFAHSKGLSVAKNEIICFIDSDTVVLKNTFAELIKPFSDKDVGCSCGQVKVMNREKNILTRSLSAMFWTSFNLNRKATGSFGYMQVASGCVSAYRKSDLDKLEHEYLNQKFLGRPCAISDDRFLTTRVQTILNKKVSYQQNAICYTYVPEGFKQCWKMIERWRRGATRELILMWKKPRLNHHFIDSQISFMLVTLITISKPMFIVMFALTFNVVFLGYYFVYFLLFLLLYSSVMIVENPRELPYKFTWALMYEFFFIFTFFDALFKIRNQGSWSTR